MRELQAFKVLLAEVFEKICNKCLNKYFSMYMYMYNVFIKTGIHTTLLKKYRLAIFTLF